MDFLNQLSNYEINSCLCGAKLKHIYFYYYFNNFLEFIKIINIKINFIIMFV